MIRTPHPFGDRFLLKPIQKSKIYATAYTDTLKKLYPIFEVKIIHITNQIVSRIKDLCNQRNISIHHLARLAETSPSTLYSITSEKHQDISIRTVKKLCNGLRITLFDFFDDDLFSH